MNTKCPCNLDTCEESWEPGCGLGNSEEHVRVYKEIGEIEEESEYGDSR